MLQLQAPSVPPKVMLAMLLEERARRKSAVSLDNYRPYAKQAQFY